MAGLFGGGAKTTTILFMDRGKQFKEADGLVIQGQKSWPLNKGRAEIQAGPGNVVVMFEGMPGFPLPLTEADLGETLPLELKPEDILAIREAKAAANGALAGHDAHGAPAGHGDTHDAHGGHDAHGPAKPNWGLIIWLSALLAGFGAIAFVIANQAVPGANGLMAYALPDIASNQVARGMMIACAVVFFVAGLIDRVRAGQLGDVIMMLLCLGLTGWAGRVTTSHDAKLVLMTAGFIAMYVAAFLGTPDMTTPGIYWMLVGAVSLWTGFRFGLTFGTLSAFSFVLMTMLFAIVHFAVDMAQIPARVLKVPIKNKFESLIWMVITILAYNLLGFFIPPNWALALGGGIMALISILGEEGVKVIQPGRTGWFAKAFTGFLQEQKIDGVLLGMVFVAVASFFGVY